MKKNNIGKILAIGIIVLFIGVGIHPAFAVDIKQSMVNKASVEDCGCNQVSDADLVKVERLLDRVEVYSKLLLVLSKYNPEIQEEFEEILDLINPDSLWDFPIICNILIGTLDILMNIEWIILNWLFSTEEGTLAHQIAEFMWETVTAIDDIIYFTGLVIGCFEPYPPLD